MAVVQSIANRKWAAGLFAVAMFWLGLLIGVAFLATPAKFLAPSLSLPVALDVGRHTFYVFNKVEWVLVAVLLLMLLSGGSIWLRILGIIAGLLVIAETVWMLPLLDQRVSLIIAGKTAPPANLHSLYIVMEFVKLFALVVIAFGAARQFVRLPANSSS
jgi:hypothetical protein